MKRSSMFLILIFLINYSFNSNTSEIVYESEFTINGKIIMAIGELNNEIWFFIEDDYKNQYVPFRNKLKEMSGNKYEAGTRGKFTLKKIKLPFWYKLSNGRALVELVKFEPEEIGCSCIIL